MTKKLILLILALPLFLMICLFTATNGVSLAVPISVSGIELLSESTVYMDLDNPKEKHLVEYAVYPTNAANQEVTFSYLPLESEDGESQPLAQFEYDDETGYLKPLAPGAAEVVITTVDGGYTARFIAIVETRELVSIESTPPALAGSFDETLGMNKYTVEPGDTFKIQNTFNPETAANLLVRYETSDSSIATVNSRGVVQARGDGVVIITVISRANEYITYSFALEVKSPEGQSIVIVDKDVVTTGDMGRINMSITAEEGYTLECVTVDKNGTPIPDANNYFITSVTTGKNGNYIEYYFNEYYGTMFLDVTLTTVSGQVTTIRCSVSRLERMEQQVIFDNENGYYEMYNEQTNELFFQILPENPDLEVSISCDNNNISVDKKATSLGDAYYSVIANPKLVGVSTLTVTITNGATGEVIVKTVPVVVKPGRILAENSVYGIEGSYTIGKYNADGTLFSHKLSYVVKDNIGEGFYENLKWETDNDAVYVDENGRIVFVEGKEVADFVTFTAKFYCAGKEVSKSQSIKIRCVSNGYNVYNYQELVKVTEEGKVVVLQNNIVEDFGKDSSGNMLPTDQLYDWMNSTYDITWYKNSGREAEARVKVLVHFKNDVYGNGHIINADNVVSMGQDGGYTESYQPILTSAAIFRGPLYFVAISDDTNGGAVSVAAQDNISFAVYENVTLNNVELISRDMDADENGNYNLQGLHYAGTTVEVLGDNVSIEYSRIRNGRNVIRAFGDINDNTKSIHVTIKNSVLREARDFIMRLGTNCFVDGSPENVAPYLPGDDKTDKTNNIDYTVRHDYVNLTESQKEEYDSKFIKTFVTVENCVLQNPGIFAIAMDSHFAGSALANGDAFKQFAGNTDALKSWYDLAKTSYGVKLTLANDVRMYCWKELETIDSSSLIEINGTLNIGKLNPNNLSFSVATMVRDAAAKNSNLKNIVYNNGSKDYVHAGIAFFGGGRNYGVLDDSSYNFHKYNAYEVSLVQVGKPEFQLAAGQESFYFYIHDATTASFLPEHQDAMLNNADEAYSCIYKK